MDGGRANAFEPWNGAITGQRSEAWDIGFPARRILRLCAVPCSIKYR